MFHRQRVVRGLSSRSLWLCITLLAAHGMAQEAEKKPSWNVEQPPGPQSEQSIDATEGTWINLDVSPDGQTIVFDLLGDIYSMPIDGADGAQGVFPSKLTTGVAWDMQPRFSPDGQHIAFTSDRTGKNERGGDNIWIMNRDGSSPRQVTQETFRLVNGAAWSPDGDYLVARKHFSSRRSLGAGEMWMFHRAALQTGSSGGVQLTQRPNDQKDVNEPVFSPDGRYLYYSQDTTPGDAFEYDKDSNQQIYVVKRLELATGKTETYISGPGGACRPTPSPDGKRIAFVRRVGAKTGLHIFDTESGAVQLVYDALERDMQEAWAIHGVYPAFAWTPDAQSIVVWAKGKIRRIDVAAGTAAVIPFHVQDSRRITKSLRFPIEVAPDNFDVKMLRWVAVSPSGSQVAFQALGHIYVRDLPDGQPRRLTRQNDHFEFYPSYSRDGRYLAYCTWDDAKLGSVRVASTDLDAAESWIVTEQPGYYIDPVFSPDGQTIVFRRSGGGYLTSPLWSQNPGVYRIATRGGRAELITEAGERPQFAQDNQRVYLQRARSDKEADNLTLFSVDLRGHNEREHYTSQWATDYCISPNGQWIAFIERFNVYVAPFIHAGKAVSVGPQGAGLPVAKVSRQAGDFIHFSGGDSQRLHWSLGPDLYTQALNNAFEFLSRPVAEPQPESEGDAKPTAEPQVCSLGFRVPYARPAGKLALVGGRLITMSPQGEIDNGVLVIDGNRIVAVGSRDQVEIPSDAVVLDVGGQVVLPGLIDVHAHGPLAFDQLIPQRNWIDYARLAFGVTTIHDPSNDTHSIFAASEMAKSGAILAPRTFSTGTILYGASGNYKADIDSLDDARFHLRRMKAVGAFSVKSYNQPRRDQRQQVIAAAREMEMMVVPEGGSTFMHNMTMIVDGHTGIEHTLPVQTAYDDVRDLWRGAEVGYTPTLSVAYGGLSGERYWYEIDDLWLHPRLQSFVPPQVLQPRSRRRTKAPLEDYNHIRVAEIAKNLVQDGGLVQAGGHGQLAGICTHWELWSFVQGGMTPLEALRCGTLYGARYLGLDRDLGSLEVGKLADVIVLEPNADPTSKIRDSERIQYTIANGQVFQSARMNAFGAQEPRPAFYWEVPGQGISRAATVLQGCGCGRSHP